MSRWVQRILLVLISGFFLLTGLSKLPETAEFTRAILRYQIVEAGLAWYAALWFPWMEVVCATSLWFSRLRLAAIWLLAGLLLMFEGVLLSAWIRGLDISCGCLGTIGDTGVTDALIRNIVLLACLMVLARMEHSRK
jgi:hypothetical protein